MKELLEKLSQPLTKDDVELRIGQTSAKGFSLLLYKTARTDIKRLNETGVIWKNKHEYDSMGLLTCIISIYNPEHDLWIDRVDVGTEGQTEKQKGLYSDSFKRAGFRWGIGLELYNAPFLWINWEMEHFNGKWKPKNFFSQGLYISEYITKEGQFTKLIIKYNNKEIYKMGEKQKPSVIQGATEDQVLKIQELITGTATDKATFLQYFKVKDIKSLSYVNAENAISTLNKKKEKMS